MFGKKARNAEAVPDGYVSIKLMGGETKVVPKRHIDGKELSPALYAIYDEGTDSFTDEALKAQGVKDPKNETDEEWFRRKGNRRW